MTNGPLWCKHTPQHLTCCWSASVEPLSMGYPSVVAEVALSLPSSRKPWSPITSTQQQVRGGCIQAGGNNKAQGLGYAQPCSCARAGTCIIQCCRYAP
jgi:hypothetical protein